MVPKQPTSNENSGKTSPLIWTFIPAPFLNHTLYGTFVRKVQSPKTRDYF